MDFETSYNFDMSTEIGKPYPKDGFMDYYTTTVRPIAEVCAKAYPAIVAAENRGSMTPEEQEEIEKLHDPLAAWYIGLMMGDISRANLNGMSLNMINSVSQVSETLKDGSSYWANVWGNETSTPEAQKLLELGKAMQVLVTKI